MRKRCWRRSVVWKIRGRRGGCDTRLGGMVVLTLLGMLARLEREVPSAGRRRIGTDCGRRWTSIGTSLLVRRRSGRRAPQRGPLLRQGARSSAGRAARPAGPDPPHAWPPSTTHRSSSTALAPSRPAPSAPPPTTSPGTPTSDGDGIIPDLAALLLAMRARVQKSDRSSTIDRVVFVMRATL